MPVRCPRVWAWGRHAAGRDLAKDSRRFPLAPSPPSPLRREEDALEFRKWKYVVQKREDVESQMGWGMAEQDEDGERPVDSGF